MFKLLTRKNNMKYTLYNLTNNRIHQHIWHGHLSNCSVLLTRNKFYATMWHTLKQTNP